MLYTTHLKFSKIIYKNINLYNNFKLKKYSFCYGNIMPDLILNFRTIPHNFNSSADYIIYKINDLIDKTNTTEELHSKAFALKLGFIDHYIADFFCWPHNKNLTKKKFINHMQYEARLDNISKRIVSKRLKKYLYLNSLCYSSSSSVRDILYMTYEEYKNSKKGILTDILFAIKTCILVNNFIIKECGNKNTKNAA